MRVEAKNVGAEEGFGFDWHDPLPEGEGGQ
jgi:hypothetical protein